MQTAATANRAASPPVTRIRVDEKLTTLASPTKSLSEDEMLRVTADQEAIYDRLDLLEEAIREVNALTARTLAKQAGEHLNAIIKLTEDKEVARLANHLVDVIANLISALETRADRDRIEPEVEDHIVALDALFELRLAVAP